MKPKNPRDFLNEAVALINPEDQQAARDALKNNTLTLALATVLALKLYEANRDAPAPSPADAGLATKVELLTTALRSIEQRLKESADARVAAGPIKGDTGTAGELKGLRGDVRAVQDGLAALRPYHQAKIAWLAAGVFIAGIVAGWFIRIEYRHWEWRQEQRREAR